MKFWKSALLYAATVCTLTATSCSDETKEPKLYTTAVTDDGNGTAEANPASAIPGETYHSSVFEFRIVPPPLIRSVRFLRILYLR